MIRAATLDDVPELLKIDKKWYEENITWNFSRLTKKQFEENIEKHIVLIAEDNDKIIGYFLATKEKATASKHTIRKNQKYLDIDSIYVLKEYRNKKIGSQLMKHFLKVAKRENYTKIKVAGSNISMIPLIRFYQQHGFKPLFAILVKDL